MEITVLGNAFLEWVSLFVGDPATNFLSFSLLTLCALGIVTWVWKYLICRKGG